MMNRIWNEESGVLTFEWILLLTVLVIGIIGGVATIRNGLNTQAKAAGGAVMALNTSYTIKASSDSTTPGGTTTDSTHSADTTLGT